MVRPALGAQAVRQALDLDPGAGPLGVHLGHGRQEGEMRAHAGELGEVAGLVARIAVEILVWARTGSG